MPTTLTLQDGRFSIEQELSGSANGIFFQAYDVQEETPVTLVEIVTPLPRLASPAQREAVVLSFQEQAKRIAPFRQRSFLPICAYFSEAGRHYIVTESQTGVDLDSILADGSRAFTVEQIAALADSVLDTLNALHNFRPALIYRNLTPGHVLLGADDEVRIAASGMFTFENAGAFGSQSAPGQDRSIFYSPLELIWGGLDAASQKVIINKYDEASERVLKQDLDARSDIFSLGAVIYHLLTGKAPVDALERSIDMIEGNPDPLTTPHAIDTTIPVEVSDVIMKALEIRREYRFDSAAIMRQVLKTALVRVREREAQTQIPEASNSIATAGPGARETSDVNMPPPAPSRVKGPKAAGSVETPVAAVRYVALSLDSEDDLLGLLSEPEHTSQAPAATQAPPAIGDTITRGSAEAQSEEVSAKSSDADLSSLFDQERNRPEEPNVGAAAVSEPLLPQTSAVTNDVDLAMFDSAKPASRLGFPAIAAAAGILLVVAVIAWFLLGQSSVPSAASPAEMPITSEPARPETPNSVSVQQNVPDTSSLNSSQPEESTISSEPDSTDVSVGSSPEQTRNAPAVSQPKPKKAAAAPKAPVRKKAVTVDDLINDN